MEVPIAYWNKYHYSLLQMVGNSSIKVCSRSSLPSDDNKKGGTGAAWSSKLHGSKLLLIWKLIGNVNAMHQVIIGKGIVGKLNK